MRPARIMALLTIPLTAFGGMALWASGNNKPSFTDQIKAFRSSLYAPRGPAHALAAEGSFSRVTVVNPNGRTVVDTWYLASNLAGQVALYNDSGAAVFGIGADEFGEGAFSFFDLFGNVRGGGFVTGDGAGRIAVADGGGNFTTYMDGNEGFVTSRRDLAENFPASMAEIAAGSVLVIDPENPGSLRPSTMPYDRRVAGVVSGANHYKPGITLGSVAGFENKVPVTLTGTVYCLASSANGPIRAGDLLTTSALAGYAMRATDLEASRGAILGKAMEDLKGDHGLILILASLQ